MAVCLRSLKKQTIIGTIFFFLCSTFSSINLHAADTLEAKKEALRAEEARAERVRGDITAVIREIKTLIEGRVSITEEAPAAFLSAAEKVVNKLPPVWTRQMNTELLPRLRTLIDEQRVATASVGASAEEVERLEKQLRTGLTSQYEEAVRQQERATRAVEDGKTEVQGLLMRVETVKKATRVGSLARAEQEALSKLYNTVGEKQREAERLLSALESAARALESKTSSFSSASENIALLASLGTQIQEAAALLSRTQAEALGAVSALRDAVELARIAYLEATARIEKTEAEARERAELERHMRALREQAEKAKREEEARTAELRAQAERDRKASEAAAARLAEAEAKAQAMAQQQTELAGGNIEATAAAYATTWAESEGLVRYKTLKAKTPPLEAAEAGELAVLEAAVATDPALTGRPYGDARLATLRGQLDKTPLEINELELLELATGVDPTFANVGAIKEVLIRHLTGKRQFSESQLAKKTQLESDLAGLKTLEAEIQDALKHLAGATYQHCDPLGIWGVNADLKNAFKLEAPTLPEKISLPLFIACVKDVNERYRSFDFVKFQAELLRDEQKRPLVVPFSSGRFKLEVPSRRTPGKMFSYDVPIFDVAALRDGFLYKPGKQKRLPYFDDAPKQEAFGRFITNLVGRLEAAYAAHVAASLPHDFEFVVKNEALARSEFFHAYEKFINEQGEKLYFFPEQQDFTTFASPAAAPLLPPPPPLPGVGGRKRLDDLIDLLESKAGPDRRIKETAIDEVGKTAFEALKALNPDFAWDGLGNVSPMTRLPAQWGLKFKSKIKALLTDDATTPEAIRLSLQDLLTKEGFDSFNLDSLMPAPVIAAPIAPAAENKALKQFGEAAGLHTLFDTFRQAGERTVAENLAALKACMTKVESEVASKIPGLQTLPKDELQGFFDGVQTQVRALAQELRAIKTKLTADLATEVTATGYLRRVLQLKETTKLPALRSEWLAIIKALTTFDAPPSPDDLMALDEFFTYLLLQTRPLPVDATSSASRMQSLQRSKEALTTAVDFLRMASATPALFEGDTAAVRGGKLFGYARNRFLCGALNPHILVMPEQYRYQSYTDFSGNLGLLRMLTPSSAVLQPLRATGELDGHLQGALIAAVAPSLRFPGGVTVLEAKEREVYAGICADLIAPFKGVLDTFYAPPMAPPPPPPPPVQAPRDFDEENVARTIFAEITKTGDGALKNIEQLRTYLQRQAAGPWTEGTAEAAGRFFESMQEAASKDAAHFVQRMNAHPTYGNPGPQNPGWIKAGIAPSASKTMGEWQKAEKTAAESEALKKAVEGLHKDAVVQALSHATTAMKELITTELSNPLFQVDGEIATLNYVCQRLAPFEINFILGASTAAHLNTGWLLLPQLDKKFKEVSEAVAEAEGDALEEVKTLLALLYDFPSQLDVVGRAMKKISTSVLSPQDMRMVGGIEGEKYREIEAAVWDAYTTGQFKRVFELYVDIFIRAFPAVFLHKADLGVLASTTPVAQLIAERPAKLGGGAAAEEEVKMPPYEKYIKHLLRALKKDENDYARAVDWTTAFSYEGFKQGLPVEEDPAFKAAIDTVVDETMVPDTHNVGIRREELKAALCMILTDLRAKGKVGIPYELRSMIPRLLILNPQYYPILDPDNTPVGAQEATVLNPTPFLESLFEPLERIWHEIVKDAKYQAGKAVEELIEASLDTHYPLVLEGDGDNQARLQRSRKALQASLISMIGKLVTSMQQEKGAFKLKAAVRDLLKNLTDLRKRRLFVKPQKYEIYLLAFMDGLGLPAEADDNYVSTPIPLPAGVPFAEQPARRAAIIEAAIQRAKDLIALDIPDTEADAEEKRRRVFEIVFTDKVKEEDTQAESAKVLVPFIGVDLGIIATVRHRNTVQLKKQGTGEDEIEIANPTLYFDATGAMSAVRIFDFGTVVKRLMDRVRKEQDPDFKSLLSYEPVVFEEELPHDVFAALVATTKKKPDVFKNQEWKDFFARYAPGWGNAVLEDICWQAFIKPLFDAPRFTKKQDVDLKLQLLFMKEWRNVLSSSEATTAGVTPQDLWHLFFTPRELVTMLRRPSAALKEREIATVAFEEIHSEYVDFLRDFQPLLEQLQEVVQRSEKIAQAFSLLPTAVRGKIFDLRNALLVHVTKQADAFCQLTTLPATADEYPPILRTVALQDAGGGKTIAEELSANTSYAAAVKVGVRYLRAAFAKTDSTPWEVDEEMLRNMPAFLDRQLLPPVIKDALKARLQEIGSQLSGLLKVKMLSQLAHRVNPFKYTIQIPSGDAKPATLSALTTSIRERLAPPPLVVLPAAAAADDTVSATIEGEAQVSIQPAVDPIDAVATGGGVGIVDDTSLGGLAGPIGVAPLHSMGAAIAHQAAASVPAWVLAQQARQKASAKQNTLVTQLKTLDKSAYGNLLQSIQDYDEKLDFLSEYGTVAHAVLQNNDLGPEHKKALLEKILEKESTLDLGIVDSDGNTVVHLVLAAKRDTRGEATPAHLELLTFALSKSPVSVFTAKNKKGEKLLDVAFKKGFISEVLLVVRALHAAGVPPEQWVAKNPFSLVYEEARDVSEGVPFANAALARIAPLIDFIVTPQESGGLGRDINEPIDKKKDTLLHCMCRMYAQHSSMREKQRRTEGIELTVEFLEDRPDVRLILRLLELGADKNLRNAEGLLPVQVGLNELYAKNIRPVEGELNLATFLLDLMTIGDRDTRDFLNLLPTMTLADFKGRIAAKRELLSQRYGLNEQSIIHLLFDRVGSPEGITAFLAAIQESLTPQDFKAIVDLRDKQGATGMHKAFLWALRKTDFGCLNLLLRHQPEVGLDIPNNEGDLPLDFVTFKILRREPALKVLLMPVISRVMGIDVPGATGVPGGIAHSADDL